MNFLDFELQLLNHIQYLFKNPLGDKFFVCMTKLGDKGLIWILITILLLSFKKTRKVGWISAIGLSFGFIMTNLLLKNIIQRPRPFNYSNIKLLIKTPKDFSFPSGHTTSSFVMFFALYKERLKIKKINVKVFICILACLISFSRLYLYVHFVTDIIGGIIMAYISIKVSKRIVNNMKE